MKLKVTLGKMELKATLIWVQNILQSMHSCQYYAFARTCWSLFMCVSSALRPRPLDAQAALTGPAPGPPDPGVEVEDHGMRSPGRFQLSS